MASIYWDESLLTGNAEIDTEHQYLFFIMNNMQDNMAGVGVDMSLERYVDMLNKYAINHFSHEEEWMSAHGYAGFEEHKKEHDDFVIEVLALETKLWDKKLAIADLKDFLLYWLNDHIRKSDMEMVRAIIERIG